MKKIILALGLVAGLIQITGSAKANITYTVHITPKYDLLNSYISAWNSTQGGGSFLYGQSLGILKANNPIAFDITWQNGAPIPDGWIFAGGGDQPLQGHVMLSSPNFLNGLWGDNFNVNYFPEQSIYASIINDKTALKNFEYYYKNILLCPPNIADKLTMFSSAVDGGTFSVINQAVPEPSTYDYTTAAVPEPSQVAASLLLVGGIAGFVIVRRRKESSEALAA